MNLTRLWQNLCRDPWSNSLAVLVLALGIGSVTAMFSVANAVLWRPLPFAEPDRLRELRVVSGQRESGIGAGDFDALRPTPGIAAMTLSTNGAVTLTGPEGAENVFIERLAGDGLAVYGVPPLAGALGSLGERSVVLSHKLWKSRYGADSAVVGRSITLNGESWTVAAIMPEGFSSGNRAALWLPWHFSERERTFHGEGVSSLVIRLASPSDAVLSSLTKSGCWVSRVPCCGRCSAPLAWCC